MTLPGGGFGVTVNSEVVNNVVEGISDDIDVVREGVVMYLSQKSPL